MFYSFLQCWVVVIGCWNRRARVKGTQWSFSQKPVRVSRNNEVCDVSAGVHHWDSPQSSDNVGSTWSEDAAC